jgi:hypothetical protein
MTLVLYLLVKFAAESGWCLLRLRTLGRDAGNAAAEALRLGLFRLVIGRIGSLLIRELGIGALGDAALAGVLAIAGWITWSALDAWIAARTLRWRTIAVPTGESLRWRLGALAVTAAADLLAVLFGLRTDELWV